VIGQFLTTSSIAAVATHLFNSTNGDIEHRQLYIPSLETKEISRRFRTDTFYASVIQIVLFIRMQ